MIWDYIKIIWFTIIINILEMKNCFIIERLVIEVLNKGAIKTFNLVCTNVSLNIISNYTIIY